MGQGWIKLHRKIRECSVIWDDKPFSRGQAWIDLLMMANHEAKDIFFDGGVYRVERGQQLTSIRKLSEIWGWSRTKTTKFLNDLKKAEMVSLKSDAKKTVITIVNYDNYQDAEIKKEPQKSHEKATEKPQKDTNKNDKELKNKRKTLSSEDEHNQKRFTPPTIDEVDAYCQERQNGITGEEFCSFYESKGWMVGKNKMISWKAAVRTWENKRGFSRQQPKQIKPSVVHTDHGDYEVVTLDDM